MSNAKWFLLSLALTTGALLGKMYVQRPVAAGELRNVSHGVYITSQLRPENMSWLRRRRISSLIDIRPDGEAADQPSSQEMEKAARASHLDFHYLPVPHESIPDETVDALAAVLARHYGTVLYCRTGRRAMRTLALAEASQPDGPVGHEILSQAKAAGFPVDDLKDRIEERILHRQNTHASR